MEWEFSDQKDAFRSLFTFLKEESRSDCYLAILQAIKVFTYVFTKKTLLISHKKRVDFFREITKGYKCRRTVILYFHEIFFNFFYEINLSLFFREIAKVKKPRSAVMLCFDEFFLQAKQRFVE